MRAVSNFFENSRWYSQLKVDHRYQRHRWSTLICEYLREFSKKFETVQMGYSGAGGKLIHEKNLKQKISWHCPFNYGVRSPKFRDPAYSCTHWPPQLPSSPSNWAYIRGRYWSAKIDDISLRPPCSFPSPLPTPCGKDMTGSSVLLYLTESTPPPPPFLHAPPVLPFCFVHIDCTPF